MSSSAPPALLPPTWTNDGSLDKLRVVVDENDSRRSAQVAGELVPDLTVDTLGALDLFSTGRRFRPLAPTRPWIAPPKLMILGIVYRIDFLVSSTKTYAKNDPNLKTFKYERMNEHQ